MKQKINISGSDIAPIEGRSKLREWYQKSDSQDVSWSGSDFTLTGTFNSSQNVQSAVLKMKGKIISPSHAKAVLPWVELESASTPRMILDLWLTGTRPLPVSNIACICRHPVNRQYLVAATLDARLLVLDGNLSANLAILNQVRVEEPIISLVACGQRLLGLTSGKKLHIIGTDQENLALLPGTQWPLPITLREMAENDGCSAWGIDKARGIYRLKLHLGHDTGSGFENVEIYKAGHLRTRRWPQFNLANLLNNLVQMIKAGQLCDCNPFSSRDVSGLAFDGQYLWSGLQPRSSNTSCRLLMHEADGSLVRSFLCGRGLSVSSINFNHNQLLVLDLDHQLLHQYCIADNLEPLAGSPDRKQHPGYLAAGGDSTGGIHDLCLLYVGGEGKTSVHRYDIGKLTPLVAYVNPQGDIEDRFMDGFLWLAQYSPLLNGAAFGTDLPGLPSRQEDWLALFDEYYHPEDNLHALDRCVEEVNQQLTTPIQSLGVVLGIPTSDRRCRDWNGAGLDLADDEARVKVTEWAVNELFQRWYQAGFKKLHLAGFYYLTEQGTLNDPVLMAFPGLCQSLGLRSYAIPGISSAWMTEFSRAGFDAVALQPSHAFWKPFSRPRFHLLKSAGRIARDYGMGMEVELPYNVLEPEGQQKVRDYLQMAAIQGWAGAFKAYFQSFNLIRDLAQSQDTDARRLYDDLYEISRCSYMNDIIPTVRINSGWDMKWQTPCLQDGKGPYFNLNVEAYEGTFHLTSLELADNSYD